MTITITKTKLALALLALTLVIPATAYATHVFDDVPDGAFYADPVEWAFDNEITTGKTPTEFAPLDDVTRGESVTFLHRYHENVVQPGLDDKADLGHDHDDRYLAEVLTAGTAASVDFAAEFTIEPTAITTTKAGRLEISVSIFIQFACSPSSSATRYYYLQVDGVPIESSVLATQSSVQEPLTLVGISPELAAGSHTISIGVECAGSNTTGSGSWNNQVLYQVAVHAA